MWVCVVHLEMPDRRELIQRPESRRTKPCFSSKEKLKTIMDGEIEGQYSRKKAIQAAQITLKCLVHDPKQCPAF